MISPSQLTAALDALRAVLAFRHPADAVLSHFFREHRQLGQQDRAFVAESVFGVLRRKLLLDYLSEGATLRMSLLLWLARFAGRSARELTPLLKPGEAEWLAEKKAVAIDDLPLTLRADLPEWIVERLQRQWPDEEIYALGRALQQPAPLDVRVNTLRADRDTVLQALAKEGLKVEPTPYSPIGIRIHGRPALNRNPLFLDGSIEVQDEGSQLLGFLLAPRRHELVVDFCAGAGGKALMLGAMMNSQGRLYAFDVSTARLARLKPRLARSGLSNLHPHAIRDEHDTKVKRLAGKIDRVLVDAPCSGLGTLRRNPDLKWRQSPAALCGADGETGGDTACRGRPREDRRPAGVCDVQPARRGEPGHRRSVSRAASGVRSDTGRCRARRAAHRPADGNVLAAEAPRARDRRLLRRRAAAQSLTAGAAQGAC